MDHFDPVAILVRDIIRGAGRLPILGAHPGTRPLVVAILVGAFAGVLSAADRDWSIVTGALFGITVISAFTVPVWAGGCVTRARLEDWMRGIEETGKFVATAGQGQSS